MAVARNGFVSLDCADPRPLAEFWAAMLGGEIMFESATTVGVRSDWVWLTALKIPDYEPPTWPEAGIPKQIHLDLAVSDLQAAVEEAERLGATVAASQPAPERVASAFRPRRSSVLSYDTDPAPGAVAHLISQKETRSAGQTHNPLDHQ
jgi:hypothetical protein